MGKPLDNPASIALRTPMEANPARPEPVVEFARKKSPVHASEAPEDIRPLSGQAAMGSDFAQPLFADRPMVSLPRDSGKPLLTSNGGYTKEALEGYRSLRTRLVKSQANQGPRAVAVTGVGRSEGKTLTAFNLACCCAQVENLSVLLIDSDLRSRSLTDLIGQLPAAGLSDVLNGHASCEEAIVRTDLPNLYVMGAGKKDGSPTELFSTESWSELIRWSRCHFKIVLVDTLSIGACADFELIAPECDGILVVVRARNTSRLALKKAVDQLDANKLIGIVWNGSNSENGNQSYS